MKKENREQDKGKGSIKDTRIAHDTKDSQKNKELTTKKNSEPSGEAKVSKKPKLNEKKPPKAGEVLEKTSQEEPKEKKKETAKPQKTEAVLNSRDLPISTKDSVAVCKFIKEKKIEEAITDLEQVLLHKKIIPMKGEIPHKKGRGIASGRYIDKTTKHFIKLLKSLSANASANELNEPIIVEAIANFASRPYGRFGRVRKKRTHVKLKVKEKKWKKEKQ